MKILHVISDLKPSSGGPPKAVLDMSTALVEDGHDVDIFTTNLSDKVHSVYSNGTIVEMKGVHIHYYGVSLLKKYPLSIPLMNAIAKNVIFFDVIHIHGFYNFHVWHTAIICLQQKVPFIIRPYGSLDPYLRKKSKVRKWFFHKIFMDDVANKATAIHYTAEEEKRLSHEQLGYTSPAIVIPLGIDLREYDQLPAKGTFYRNFPQLENHKFVLFLGRINFKKGLDLLAEAFGKLSDVYPDLRLVIVGPEDKDFGDQVRKWLAENKVLNKTIFTGMLHGQEKISAFVDAEVFVLPSYSENFGLTLLEALACKTPVITTNKVNIWHEIKNAKAGQIIGCDVDELVNAIQELLNNESLRQTNSDNGRRMIEAQFTWKQISKSLIFNYEQAIDRLNK